MIINLFSVFDQTSSFLTNWLRILTPFLFIVISFWLIPSRPQFLVKRVLMGLDREISLLIGPNRFGASILVISLFLFILFNHFIGLFPYIFTATRHLTVTLRLAVPLWISFIMYAWIKETTNVLITNDWNMIRPITLSVRLAANMVASHLLLTLLGDSGKCLYYYNCSVLANCLIKTRILSGYDSILCFYYSNISLGKRIMNQLNQPYHLVSVRLWHLATGIGAFAMTSGLVKWFHSFDRMLFFTGLATIVFVSYQWWRDVSREATFFYNFIYYFWDFLFCFFLLSIFSQKLVT